MSDEVGAGVLLAVVIAFCVMGLVWLIESFFSTTLPHERWECTEAVVLDGKAECVKWER